MLSETVIRARLLPLAVPVMLVWPIVFPALAVLFSGRDLLNPETLDPGSLNAFSEWMLRLVTLAMLCGGLALVLDRALLDRTPKSADRGQWLLLAAFLAFFLGNALIPGLLGAVPYLSRNTFYVLVLFLAVFARRNDGPDRALDALQWALLIFFLASFVYAPLRPDAALRNYPPENRLPGVPFRFWGLGPNANAMGPLALVLLLLAITRPARHALLQGLTLAAAVVVLLLAQSQTAWLATGLLVPPLLLYRRALAQGRRPALRFRPAAALAVSGLVFAGLVLLVALAVSAPPARIAPTGGLTGHGELLTGRGTIWRVAWEVFLSNPLFGYGPLAWTLEFRTGLHMPYATSAHNQLLQSLSVGGLFGGIGFVFYALALAVAAFRRASATGGLAPAMLALAAIRSLTETPFDISTFLLADTALHALLFAICLARRGSLAHPAPEMSDAAALAAPPPRHRRLQA